MRTNSLDLVTHDSLEMGTSYVQDVQPPWRLSPFLGWNSRAKKADQGPHGSFTAGSVEVPTATDVETPPLIKAGSSLCLLSFKCVHHWALSARRVFVILFCSLYIKENALPYFPWFWEINAFHGNFITSVFIEVNHSSLSLPPEDVSVDPWIVLSPSINRAGITLHVLPVVNVGAGPGPTPTWQAWPQWEHISVDSALLSSSLLCSEYFWSKSCVYRGVGVIEHSSAVLSFPSPVALFMWTGHQAWSRQQRPLCLCLSMWSLPPTPTLHTIGPWSTVWHHTLSCFYLLRGVIPRTLEAGAAPGNGAWRPAHKSLVHEHCTNFERCLWSSPHQWALHPGHPELLLGPRGTESLCCSGRGGIWCVSLGVRARKDAPWGTWRGTGADDRATAHYKSKVGYAEILQPQGGKCNVRRRGEVAHRMEGAELALQTPLAKATSSPSLGNRRMVQAAGPSQ